MLFCKLFSTILFYGEPCTCCTHYLTCDSTPLKGVILGGRVGSGAVGVVGVVAVGVCEEPTPEEEDPEESPEPPEPPVSQQEEPSEENTVSRPESACEAGPCRDICNSTVRLMRETRQTRGSWVRLPLGAV